MAQQFGSAQVARPTTTRERVAVLDVLRGAAILGILLVNIELFRGADFYAVLSGQIPDYGGADEGVQFLVGWLVQGKFLSSFALLFGLGAAIMIARAGDAGRSPRGLLARRYAWLAVIGLAHMVVLFSGDILFVYALAGLVLLAFAFVRARTALWWAAGIGVVYLLVLVGVAALSAAMPEPAAQGQAQQMEAFFAERAEFAQQAFADGGLGAQLAARGFEALLVQGGQLFAVPWILALFLVGLAAGKAGLHRRLGEPWVARTARLALPVGLAANLPLGFAGSLGAAAAMGPGGEVSAGQAVAIQAAYHLGAPLLAVGYLSLLAWLCQRPGVLARLTPLQRTGRMALSAYLLQSLLCTGFFVGLGFYGQLSPAPALAVVAAVWVVVVAVCTAWLARFDMGPVERLWRRLTYGPTVTADATA